MLSHPASRSFRIGDLTLRNRLVATAHGSGAVSGGLAQPGDDTYWQRCAAGGAAMVIAGGTVVSADSANRTGNITEAWRPEAAPGLERRARAITREGAIAVCQLVHLGRETLGAEIWGHPIAPSAVRSPREQVTARVMSAADVERVIEDFTVSSERAFTAGFPAVELHAAHGYLLAQFFSPHSNTRPEAATVAGRADIVNRIAESIRSRCPGIVLGIRVSIDGAEEAGLDLDGLCALLPYLDGFDYVNVTAGVRTTYVRDMATTTPPLLGGVSRLRASTARPLLVSQAFRDGSDIESALAAGADLVGLARPLIADPYFPRKLLEGREKEIRPCVSCNEDCRTFTPVLLCSVNPELAPPGLESRPAIPLLLSPSGTRSGGRVAIVGAGPAGLETALRLRGAREVTLFDSSERIGGQIGTAALAPHRSGWNRLLDYYSHNLRGIDLRLGERVLPEDLADYDDIVIATGAVEAAVDGTLSATEFIGGEAAVPNRHVVVIDDGFGSWPTVSALEVALARGAALVTVVSSGPAFAASIPPESRVQLVKRLSGAPVELSTCMQVTDVSGTGPLLVTVRNILSHKVSQLSCDVVITVGERVASRWDAREVNPNARVQMIGDALVPRRVSHAVAEGYAAAQLIRA